MHPAHDENPLSPPAAAVVRRALADGGVPLPESVRGPAERRIGMDFSRVRVHTGERAAAASSAVGARAFAVGPHIVFGPGSYQAASPAGVLLVTHELTHVAQQSAAGEVQLARQTDPDAQVLLGALDSPALAAVAQPIVGEAGWSVLREFLRGLWGGLLSAPAEQLDRIQKKADDFGVVNGLKYVGGYVIGILEGLWTGVKNLVESIWTLLKLPFTLTDFLFEKLPELVVKYGPRIASALNDMGGLGERISNMLKNLLDHPRESIKQIAAFMDEIKSLALGKVRELGRAASGKLLALLEEPWFDFGRDIGKVVGQILFEVILLVASEGIATAVKSALRIGGEIAARVATKAVELIRSVGRLIGEALEWIRAVGRRLAGQLGEAFKGLEDLLARIDKLFAELVGDPAVADTGVGGVKLPVPEPTPPPPALESHAVKPPSAAGAERPVAPKRGGRAGTSAERAASKLPKWVEEYVGRLRKRYPKLAEANLRPVARDVSQPGLYAERELTGSGSALEADWAERTSGKIQIDDINEEGKLLDVKERGSGRQYSPREPKEPAPQEPDIYEQMQGKGGRARPEPWKERMPEKDETQLAEQVRFAKQHSLTGVEWRTTNSEYARLVRQTIRERGWGGFAEIFDASQ